MASAQSTLKTGDRQVLGKRSREPLAELTPNAQPKRSKPASDLHTGENVDKPSDYVSSSDDKVALDDVADEIFDADEEDVVDVGPAEDAEQRDTIRHWFGHCDKRDKLSDLSPEERLRRIQKCHERYAFMLASLIQAAKDWQKSDFDDQHENLRQPFTFAWWIFLPRLSCEKVMVLLMASLPDAVKVILGGPLTNDELLLLPKQWKKLNLWAVYGDFLTRNVGETARYCGSATGKDGVMGRLDNYARISNHDRKPESTKHGAWLAQESVKMNLRVIAVFNKCDTEKPYVLLMELLSSILLQVFPSDPSAKKWRTASALAMVRKATPLGLPEVKHVPLNGAVQCLQGLWHRKRHVNEVCLNCKKTEQGHGCAWFTANPGLPLTGVICDSCYHHKRRHGIDRPIEMETRRVHLRNMEAAIGEKPAEDARCPGCGYVPQADKTGQWLLPKGDHQTEAGRERYECFKCYAKPTRELPISSFGKTRAGWLALAPAKPAGRAVCPGCSAQKEAAYAANRNWQLPPNEVLEAEPNRLRWECRTCAARPTGSLGRIVRVQRTPAELAAKKTLRAQVGDKPPNTVPCPGCGGPMGKGKWCVSAVETGRCRWECSKCFLKPDTQLKIHP